MSHQEKKDMDKKDNTIKRIKDQIRSDAYRPTISLNKCRQIPMFNIDMLRPIERIQDSIERLIIESIKETQYEL